MENRIGIIFNRCMYFYSFSSLLSLALGLVTLMHNCCALSTRAFLFLAETP